MLDITQDPQSSADYQSSAADVIERLRKTKRPMGPDKRG
jgi:hypothetical protein